MNAIMKAQESFPEVFTWTDPQGGAEITLRRVTLKNDLKILHEWMNYPHVAEFWKLDKSREELHQHFTKALADDHHRLYIININGVDLAYTELYHAARDRLAEKYSPHPDDWGIHLLIGPREQIGKGYSESIVRCLIHCIFACTAAEKVVGEPDSRVKAFLKLAEYIGYENQGLIEFPEKTAVLFYCYREKFYSLNQT